ncbi:MAG: hypothetical protein M1825_005141 [Sarcosagium campestre]|nr:MAG: hypothetical protein M1825_005141 [Sarcosagium campestre]
MSSRRDAVKVTSSSSSSSTRSSDSGYYSSGARSARDGLVAYDPHGRDSGRTQDRVFSRSNTVRELVRTPNPTGMRHREAGGPGENPHGYEKVTRKHTSGRVATVYNYGHSYDEVHSKR